MRSRSPAEDDTSYAVTAPRARKLDSAAQTAERATRYPAATVKTSGGPSPAFAPNTCAPATATTVGPSPAPSATFRKKLIDIASPRERFGTTSRIAEKPTAVTMPDRAKYNGTPASTKVKVGEFISSENGNINRPEYKQTRSLRGHPPRAPARSARAPPMSTPPPKPTVKSKPNSTPIWAGSWLKPLISSVGAHAPTALSTNEAAANTI